MDPFEGRGSAWRRWNLLKRRLSRFSAAFGNCFVQHASEPSLLLQQQQAQPACACAHADHASPEQVQLSDRSARLSPLLAQGQLAPPERRHTSTCSHGNHRAYLLEFEDAHDESMFRTAASFPPSVEATSPSRPPCQPCTPVPSLPLPLLGMRRLAAQAVQRHAGKQPGADSMAADASDPHPTQAADGQLYQLSPLLHEPASPCTPACVVMPLHPDQSPSQSDSLLPDSTGLTRELQSLMSPRANPAPLGSPGEAQRPSHALECGPSSTHTPLWTCPSTCEGTQVTSAQVGLVRGFDSSISSHAPLHGNAQGCFLVVNRAFVPAATGQPPGPRSSDPVTNAALPTRRSRFQVAPQPQDSNTNGSLQPAGRQSNSGGPRYTGDLSLRIKPLPAATVVAAARHSVDLVPRFTRSGKTFESSRLAWRSGAGSLRARSFTSQHPWQLFHSRSGRQRSSNNDGANSIAHTSGPMHRLPALRGSADSLASFHPLSGDARHSECNSSLSVNAHACSAVVGREGVIHITAASGHSMVGTPQLLQYTGFLQDSEEDAKMGKGARPVSGNSATAGRVPSGAGSFAVTLKVMGRVLY